MMIADNPDLPGEITTPPAGTPPRRGIGMNDGGGVSRGYGGAIEIGINNNNTKGKISE